MLRDMDTAGTLRNARACARMTQQELASAAGTSQATISAYESGRKKPSVDTYERLLAASGARLRVELGRSRVRVPSRREHEASARKLAAVLELAAALPTRHAPLAFPPLQAVPPEPPRPEVAGPSTRLRPTG